MSLRPAGQIAPGHIKALASQVDYPAILLGPLNWNYASRCFKQDVRATDPKAARYTALPKNDKAAPR